VKREEVHPPGWGKADSLCPSSRRSNLKKKGGKTRFGRDSGGTNGKDLFLLLLKQAEEGGIGTSKRSKRGKTSRKPPALGGSLR